jgi:hypothetical protein
MWSTTGLGVMTLCAALALPQMKTDVRDLRDHPFEAALSAGSHLRLNLRSGDVRIRGRDDNTLTVHLASSDPEGARDVRLHLDRADHSTTLEISGGPRNDIHLTIELPKASPLVVRMSAGNLDVEGITGDKDIELYAGDLTIAAGDPTTYAHVDASVTAGDIEARPFGESHGGLFRSFYKAGAGKYTLHAHVIAGDLTIK